MNFDKELDARGLNCPAAHSARQEGPGRTDARPILRILATDPGSVKDFQAFAKQTGNELLSSAENNKEFEFFIKRK